MYRLAIVSVFGALSCLTPAANAATKIIGNIDSVASQGNGSVIISGWACDMSVAQSIDVHAYGVNAAGLSGAVLVGNSKANLKSAAAISTSCKTSGIAHNFQITVPVDTVRKYLGKKVYVHGISKSGGLNYTITKSGSFAFPTSIAVAPTTPAPVVQTGVFNAVCYLARYPDVKASATYGKNPQLHYTNLGKKEGRIPGCLIGADSKTSMSIDILPSQFAGAITSLKWNGREFINIYDHGRQLQSAMQVDGYAECNNPTEAGSEADARKSTSTSALSSIQFASKDSFTAETMMAYWSASRVTGACVKGKDPRVTTPQSKHILHKTVSIGYKSDQQIAKIAVTFKSPRNDVSSAFVYEYLTGYLNSEFTQFYNLNGNTLAKVTKLNDISGSGFPAGSYHAGSALPSAMASADGSYAMGVYFPMSQLAKCSTAFHGYNLYKFNLGGSGATGNATNKWSLAVNEPVNSACVIADGSYYNRTFEVYVVVGTLDQVQAKLIKLKSELP
jgi:hypothetical protein